MILGKMCVIYMQDEGSEAFMRESKITEVQETAPLRDVGIRSRLASLPYISKHLLCNSSRIAKCTDDGRKETNFFQEEK
jgi:hypothetical protein